MPVFELEANGKTFEIEAPSQEAAISAFQGQMGNQSPKTENAAGEGADGHLGHKIGAFTDQMAQGLTFGTSDEIAAGLSTGFGYLGDYDKALADERARMDENMQKAGGYGLAGGVTGGLLGAGGLAKSGVTLMGRGLGTKAAIAEGAGYGAAFGAGTSEEGERLSGAAKGAVTGAVTAGVVDKVGRGIANKVAQRNVSKIPAPTVDELGAQANQFYQKAENAGVSIKPKAMQRLGNNVLLSAGRLNDKLRPKTAGIVEDFADMMNKPVSLKEFDEMRQVVGQAMKRAEPQDVRTLTLIKNQMDAFADTIKPADITGDIKGFSLIKEGRTIYAKKAKLELIESLFDDVQRKTANFTQSGEANALKTVFGSLDKKVSKDKRIAAMFTDAEKAEIKKLALNANSSNATKFLAKFAPRGVISTILGMGGGMGAGGPVGAFALPLAGHAAAKAVDRGAMGAAQRLKDGIARGSMATPQALPKMVRPLIPLAGQGSGTLASQ